MQCQNALNIFCLTHYPLLKSVSLLNAVENLQILHRTYLFAQIKKPDTIFRAFIYLLAIILHLLPYLTFQQDLRLRRLR